jgi:hypothetical protein
MPARDYRCPIVRAASFSASARSRVRDEYVLPDRLAFTPNAIPTVAIALAANQHATRHVLHRWSAADGLGAWSARAILDTATGATATFVGDSGVCVIAIVAERTVLAIAVAVFIDAHRVGATVITWQRRDGRCALAPAAASGKDHRQDQANPYCAHSKHLSRNWQVLTVSHEHDRLSSAHE